MMFALVGRIWQSRHIEACAFNDGLCLFTLSLNEFIFLYVVQKCRKGITVSLEVLLSGRCSSEQNKAYHKIVKSFHACSWLSCEREECERAFKTVSFGSQSTVPSVPCLYLRHFGTCHISAMNCITSVLGSECCIKGIVKEGVTLATDT